MSEKLCDAVQKALAAGEPLEPGQSGHVVRCAACGEAARTAARVREALAARPRPSVGEAFTARAAEGGRARAARRARVRATMWSGGAVAAAAAAVIVLALRDRPADEPADRATAQPTAPAPAEPEVAPAEDDGAVVEELVFLSDVEAGMHIHARWQYAEEPIAELMLIAPDAMPLGRGPGGVR